MIKDRDRASLDFKGLWTDTQTLFCQFQWAQYSLEFPRVYNRNLVLKKEREREIIVKLKLHLLLLPLVLL